MRRKFSNDTISGLMFAACAMPMISSKSGSFPARMITRRIDLGRVRNATRTECLPNIFSMQGLELDGPPWKINQLQLDKQATLECNAVPWRQHDCCHNAAATQSSSESEYLAPLI